jgi:cell division cycle 2-like
MWSVGCIFAELLFGSYFFMGTSEVDQLSKIFSVLGQPSPDKWHDFELLPNAGMLKWKGLPKESKLRDK